MIWNDHGFTIEEPEILRDDQRCATAEVSAARQSEVETVFGPIVAARTATRNAANQHRDRPEALRMPPWPERVIDVYLHIITSGDGQAGRLQTADIDGQMAALNYQFSSTDFQFKLVGTDYTANDSWFAMAPGSIEEGDAKTALRKGTAEDLNIYTAAPEGRQRGWATFPWSYEMDHANDGIVIAFTRIMPASGRHGPYSKSRTIAHQIGHWAGLYHTFQGGCTEPGDWVSDTGAQKSPTVSFDIPSTRQSCGVAYDPIHNTMNFTEDEWMWGFTPLQGDRMSAAFDAYRSGK
jgi:Pregnancy-associated plasma protein-A